MQEGIRENRSGCAPNCAPNRVPACISTHTQLLPPPVLLIPLRRTGNAILHKERTDHAQRRSLPRLHQVIPQEPDRSRTRNNHASLHAPPSKHSKE
jgi:hypothetical protein